MGSYSVLVGFSHVSGVNCKSGGSVSGIDWMLSGIMGETGMCFLFSLPFSQGVLRFQRICINT